MGSSEWLKWLRLNGFDSEHPHPGPDLGYDGRELDIGTLEEVDTDEYDYYWQDPIDTEAWLLVREEILITDLEAWA